MINPRTACGRRVFLPLLAAAVLASAAAPAGAAPMPPQVPTPDEVARLQAHLQSALLRVRSAQAALDRVVAEFEQAHDELAGVATRIVVAGGQLEALDAELRAARAVINHRAASVYRSERVGLVNVLLSARSYRDFVASVGLIRSVTEQDSKSLGRLRELKAEAARVREELEQRRADRQRAIRDLARRQRQVETSLHALGQEYQQVKAEVERRRAGFAFPVQAPYSYVDSWGAPRMVGTEYYHRHEGTDVFALRGTPVVAVVDGVVERVGTAVLGGIKLWLRSPDDGWTYFYAHLSGYAPGIQDGLRVRKGEVVGYVGDTGNARGTPPHLHFEAHVPAGRATNPYPILRRVDPLAP